MSDQQSIIVAPPPAVATVTLTPGAIALREAALDASALVARVSTPRENETAVHAQTELARVSKLYESARKTVTQPLLDAQRKIKATIDKERKDLEQELLRVSRLIGDYQALEMQRIRAAEAARAQAASDLERERMEALAKAKSDADADAIQQEYNERAAIEATPPPEPVRAEGQRVTTDWEITRLSEHVLAKARPDLVRKIEFDMRAVKSELQRGVKLPGVEAREVVKSGVITRAQHLIDV